MNALVRVADVEEIGVGLLKEALTDFSHRTTLPTCPLRVRSAGEVLVQMVCGALTAPPTLTGSTDRDAEEVMAVSQSLAAVILESCSVPLTGEAMTAEALPLLTVMGAVWVLPPLMV